MRLSVILCCMGFAFFSLNVAGFELDDDLFHNKALDKAKKQAKEEKKPIAFLYTDKDSNCPKCIHASKIMMNELKDDTVMVYAPTEKTIPPKVKKLLSSRGKYIPKLAVADWTCENTLGMVTYEEVKKEGDDALDAVREKISEHQDELEETAELLEKAERLKKNEAE